MTKEQKETVAWIEKNWKVKVTKTTESRIDKDGRDLERDQPGAIFVETEPDKGMEILIEPDGKLAN